MRKRIRATAQNFEIKVRIVTSPQNSGFKVRKKNPKFDFNLRILEERSHDSENKVFILFIYLFQSP